MDSKFDIDFVREQFPGLKNDMTFFDNAGGSQVCNQVMNRFQEYLVNHNVQFGASYETSKTCEEQVMKAKQYASTFLNCKKDEIVFGPSTRMMIRNLAQDCVHSGFLEKGDEVIITNVDHEANTLSWLSLEKFGIIVKVWEMNPETFNLEIQDLDALITENTKLVAFTHCSNVCGQIVDAKAITDFAHSKGVKVCIDGVAYVPHRAADVQEIGCDFYAFSVYKLFGIRYAALYINEDLIKSLGVNKHTFWATGINFECAYSFLGVKDYFNEFVQHHGVSTQKSNSHEELNELMNDRRVGQKTEDRVVIEKAYEIIAEHEEKLCEILLNFLKQKQSVTLIGTADCQKEVRVPVISFYIDGLKSSELTAETDKKSIGVKHGMFNCNKLMEDLGIKESHNGCVRISMLHYNSFEEVEKLIHTLDKIIPY